MHLRLISIAILSLMPATLIADQSIIVQSTTSTKNSGLYDHLLPAFKKATGITAYVVAVGTGQAIRNARNCDGDVLLVHAKTSEEKFVADGFGVHRYDLMYNDFVIVGPPGDPAGIAGSNDVTTALQRIANAKAPFVSRGDDSGTHKKERQLWELTGIDPSPDSGSWYLETGQGMGASVNVAIESGAYIMTDRATWLSFNRPGTHRIHVEGDKQLFNQYGLIQINSDKCPKVNTGPAQQFVQWLTSSDGQQQIASYRVGEKQLFFPNAGR